MPSPLNWPTQWLAQQFTARVQKRGLRIAQRVLNGRQRTPLEVNLRKTYEAIDSELGIRLHPEQLAAGAIMAEPMGVQLPTGEGKTLAGGVYAALRALEGRQCHVVVPNNYLAKRDAEIQASWMASLGLTVEHLQPDMSIDERRAAYRADVLYGSPASFVFDWLKEGVARRPHQKFRQQAPCVLVDEMDSVCLDSARSEFILSRPCGAPEVDIHELVRVVETWEEGRHFELGEDGRSVEPTSEGFDALGKDMHDGSFAPLLGALRQALFAVKVLARDVDYIVHPESGVQIVDAITGRLLLGRRWSNGLHQAVEAKEGLPISAWEEPTGRSTIDGYLALYDEVTGMSATLSEVSREIEEIFALPVVPLAHHHPRICLDLEEAFFETAESRNQALLDEVSRAHKAGQPVLVAATTEREAADLHEAISELGIQASLLTAKHLEREAELLEQAGQKGAVTVATQVAGRGTDIRLGGTSATEAEREKVAEVGGLYVLGTQRNFARRVDLQLKGRAGRQGDPGCTRLYGSLDDELLVRFGHPEDRSALSTAVAAGDHDRVGHILDQLQERAESLQHQSREVSRGTNGAFEHVQAHHRDRRTTALLASYEPMSTTDSRVGAFVQGVTTVLERWEGVNGALDANPGTGRSARWVAQELFGYWLAESLEPTDVRTQLATLVGRWLATQYDHFLLVLGAEVGRLVRDVCGEQSVGDNEARRIVERAECVLGVTVEPPTDSAHPDDWCEAVIRAAPSSRRGHQTSSSIEVV